MTEEIRSSDEARHHFARAKQLCDDAARFDRSKSHASADWCRAKAARHAAKARQLQAAEYNSFLSGDYEVVS